MLRLRPRLVASLALLALCAGASAPAAGEAPGLATELVVGGFTLPVFATAPAGDDRIFVLEQNSGLIRIGQGGAILPTPFLDVKPKLTSGGERGLLGLAFHPDYGVNGRFYVSYNDLAGDVVLERYLVDPLDPNRALPGSGELLLTLVKPFTQHNAGMLAFSPLDHMLVMSTGDGGSGGDPLDNAQDLSSLLGKLLRIDVDGPFPYGIPGNNPFVGTPGAAPEIYAYGLRNPWRFSFDRQTGAILVADVGQNDREEIDFIRGHSPGGQNFGWRCMEGTACTHIGTCACPVPLVVAPIHEFDHNEGCAIIGGYVYRGRAIPGLKGHYFFGDYCTSRVWSFEIVSGQAVGLVDHTQELNPPGGTLGFITSFGEDGAGELLVVGYMGDIRRVVQAEVDPDCDGDGVPDAEEIATGTAFDVNADGIPDACQLQLTGSDMVKGQIATLDFVGAAPSQPLAWFGSIRGIGPGPCFFGGSLCLDLLPFNYGSGTPEVLLMGITFADAQGHGSFPFFVPTVLPGTDEVAFQLVAAAGMQSVKSNPIQKVLQDP